VESAFKSLNIDNTATGSVEEIKAPKAALSRSDSSVQIPVFPDIQTTKKVKAAAINVPANANSIIEPKN